LSENLITKDDVLGALRGARIHPSIPDVIVAIINITRSDRASLTDLVNAIEKDEVLSKRLMSIGNSGFFGKERKVRHVQEAVVMMGWNNVKMISLGSTIMKVISKTDMRLYGHAIKTAQYAHYIATEAKLYKIEDITLVGLLHNIGSVILLTYFTNEALQAKQYAIKHGVPIQVAERAVLGVDHAEIGGWTVAEWKLPDNIIETISEHHDFYHQSFHARKTAAIHIGECLALMADYTGPAWEKINTIHPDAVKKLGFSEDDFRSLALKCLKKKFEPIIM